MIFARIDTYTQYIEMATNEYKPSRVRPQPEQSVYKKLCRSITSDMTYLARTCRLCKTTYDFAITVLGDWLSAPPHVLHGTSMPITSSDV